jgi:hypothetical protein
MSVCTLRALRCVISCQEALLIEWSVLGESSRPVQLTSLFYLSKCGAALDHRFGKGHDIKFSSDVFKVAIGNGKVIHLAQVNRASSSPSKTLSKEIGGA